jgi:MFS family permease
MREFVKNGEILTHTLLNSSSISTERRSHVGRRIENKYNINHFHVHHTRSINIHNMSTKAINASKRIPVEYSSIGTEDEHVENLVIDPPLEDMASSVSWHNKFLFFIELAPHVSKLNMAVFYLLSMVTISLFVFVNAAQPFVLQTYLKIPNEQQGVISGNLIFCNEIVILLSAYLCGALSDLLGSRKFVYVAGFLLMSIGLGLYPFATTVLVLYIFRVIFAVGAAGTSSMLTAVLGDYTVDKDRGKATGLLGVLTGFGAVISAVLFLKLPIYFEKAHFNQHEAGYLTYGIVALLSSVMCLCTLFGLKGPIVATKKRGTRKEKSENVDSMNHISTEMQQRKPILILIKEGMLAAKDPMVLLSYMASFVARGDAVLITTFITLWVSQAMQSQYDATPSEALARAGLVSGIAQTCALVAAPFVGFLSDRINRLGTLILLSIISGIGYTMTHILKDVTRGFVFFPVCLIGIGEIGVIISSQVLVSQYAPPKVRGSVSGVFALMGAIGILTTTKIGGLLYDHWRPSGPFVLIGIFNFILSATAACILMLQILQKRKVSYSHVMIEEEEEEEVEETINEYNNQ